MEPNQRRALRRGFAYLRGDEADDHVLVVVNYSANDVDAEVPLPAVMVGAVLEDVWSGDQIDESQGETLTMTMPAWSFIVLKQAG